MEERATVCGLPSGRHSRGKPLAPTLRDHQSHSTSVPQPRRFIAGYELLEEIGQGGMGVVYKARQVRLDRLVALKMLRTSLATREDLLRFRTEAEAIARLQHPGIVQVFEIGDQEGQPFLSLEYCAGGSLEKQLAGRPMPAQEAALLTRRLAEAVQAAHDANVIHRDLKPANVLLAEDAFPKITDFGLAKKLGDASLTHPGAIIGTPSYMAPEQAQGRGMTGVTTDVYALGAILYECLTGRPPFVAGTVFDTLEMVRRYDPAPPRSLNPSVPRDLENICLKCLEKSPARRYAAARDLADDLTRFLEGMPIRARAVGIVERSLKWARRRPTATALAVVSALLVTVLVTAVPLHIIRLRARIQETRLAVEKAMDEKQRADLRAISENRLAEGRAALARGTLATAERAMVSFATAQESIREEDAARDPELRRLREEATHLRRQASAELERLMGAGSARVRARRFLALRDEAFFQLYHGLMGVADAGRPRASLEASLRALEIYPELDCLTCDQRQELRTAHLEVLLLVAEATATLESDPERLREALELLDRAAQQGGPQHAVHLRRARYLELLGQREAADRERALARRTPPSGPLDYFLRGQERWLAGDISSALVDFDRALVGDPDLFWARMLRAVGLHRLRKPTEARAELGLCIRARPGFAWPYLLRAFLLVQARQFADASADLDRVEKLPLDEPARYALHVHRGVLALARGRRPEAIKQFQHAILLCPRLPHAHANLAEAYWRNGDRGRALLVLNHTVELEPLRADLYRTRCRLLLELGDFSGALRDLEYVVDLDPLPEGDGVPLRAADLREQARLLFLLRRHADALPVCQKALALEPDHTGALRLRAELLLELGQFREALVAFDRYLTRGKPDLDLYRRRARARAAIGDLPGVVDEYTLALSLSRAPAVHVARGWAYLMTGSPRPAFRDFEAALQQAPEDAEALIGRGSARLDLGDLKLAQTDLEAGLRRQPTSARVLYAASRGLARLAGRLPRPSREVQTRALAVLRQAIEALPPTERLRFLREQIRRDEAFRLLVSRGELDSLEKQLQRDQQVGPTRDGSVSR
ncbi:MAG: tetratricopeptide repeat protein [Gemmataceae bacterium]